MSTTNQLTEQEKRACVVLSDLFLDTELTEMHFNYMTSELRLLGFSVAALEEILRYDLFPALLPNLLCVAGEWAVFDEDWLLERVEAGRCRGWVRSGVNFLVWYSLRRMVLSHWEVVKERLNDGSKANM